MARNPYKQETTMLEINCSKGHRPFNYRFNSKKLPEKIIKTFKSVSFVQQNYL